MLPGVCCEYQIYKHINNITKVANKEAVRILYDLNMVFYYLNVASIFLLYNKCIANTYMKFL